MAGSSTGAGFSTACNCGVSVDVSHYCSARKHAWIVRREVKEVPVGVYPELGERARENKHPERTLLERLEERRQFYRDQVARWEAAREFPLASLDHRARANELSWLLALPELRTLLQELEALRAYRARIREISDPRVTKAQA